MRRSQLVCLTLFLLTAVAPSAEALPLFLSGKIGNASLDASLGDRFSQVLDGDDDAWALGLGYRLGKRWVFMAEYHDLGDVPGFGSPCPQSAELCPAVEIPIEAESEATTLSAQANLPVFRQRLLLYAKAGVVAWSSDVSQTFGAADRLIDDFDDEGLLLGVGLRVNLPGPIDFFGEIERLTDDFELVHVGVTLGF